MLVECKDTSVTRGVVIQHVTDLAGKDYVFMGRTYGGSVAMGGKYPYGVRIEYHTMAVGYGDAKWKVIQSQTRD